MSRSFVGALVGLGLTAAVFGGGSASAAAPAEDPKVPVCVGASVAGLDLNQLCQK